MDAEAQMEKVEFDLAWIWYGKDLQHSIGVWV